MAYEVKNYTGGGAATSDYPHGLWVDNTGTGGGTLINKLALSDVYQFFMRLMDDAGVSFNNSPDTVTNGFQFVQALNAQVGKFNNAWSGLMGASGLTPVILSGCVVTVPTFGHYSITAGYCWYNGLFTIINAATSVAVGSGFSPYIYISLVDGVPVGNLQAFATGSPTTSYEFPTSIFVSNPITVLQTNVATLQTEVAIGSWNTVGVTSGFTFGTGWTALGVFQMAVDGMGRVYVKGILQAGSGAGTTMVNFPGTFAAYPGPTGSGLQGFVCTRVDGGVSVPYPVEFAPVAIVTAGTAYLIQSPVTPTTGMQFSFHSSDFAF